MHLASSAIIWQNSARVCIMELLLNDYDEHFLTCSVTYGSIINANLHTAFTNR